MMKRKVKTPDQLAKEKKRDTTQISVIVDTAPIVYLREQAAQKGLTLSDLVNEAIKAYVEDIKTES